MISPLLCSNLNPIFPRFFIFSLDFVHLSPIFCPSFSQFLLNFPQFFFSSFPQILFIISSSYARLAHEDGWPSCLGPDPNCSSSPPSPLVVIIITIIINIAIIHQHHHLRHPCPPPSHHHHYSDWLDWQSSPIRFRMSSTCSFVFFLQHQHQT